MDHAFCFISNYLLSTPKSNLSSSFCKCWALVWPLHSALLSKGLFIVLVWVFEASAALVFFVGKFLITCLVFFLFFPPFFETESFLKKIIITFIYLFCECGGECLHAGIYVPRGMWGQRSTAGVGSLLSFCRSRHNSKHSLYGLVIEPEWPWTHVPQLLQCW